ncbi:hypothetical protein JMN32_15000 [Fulvivirga sp. 29W222]|uniref:Uncharacterized protein n=1 Tax=Fulvivirga marina TaxID=2494733 RepID=A0A937FWZ9_9BACT|nr:hypothetical protein [Fulvivirga marina]MBL6447624.1 hypothetical protein [Fulvivirga marina]
MSAANKYILEAKELIRYNIGLSIFVQSFVLSCPNHPKEHQLATIDQLKYNYCRYTKRTMYYAENFVMNLESINDKLSKHPDFSTKEFITAIPDNIFFDFDAFLFSCKSLVEGKVIERGKEFHSQVLNKFMKYSKKTFNQFIQTYLNPLRDEVVHLNNFGSAIGSMVHIKDGDIMIKAFDYSDEMELQKVFNEILTNMSDIIKNLAQFIVLHECHHFGFPTKDSKFSTGYGDFQISDFVEIDK